LYNKILLEATSLDDLEKCEQLEIEDVYNTCVSSINLRYWEIWMAKILEDCEKVWATEKESKEFRQDVCKYNVIKKMDKYTTDYEKLCWEIVNEDIKNACIWNFKR